MTEWKIGDIANGHILVTSGWVPLRNRAQNAGPNWLAGDVVNGHAFTGETWVPLPGLAVPVTPHPNVQKEPGWFSRISTGKKIALLAGVPIGLIVLGTLVGLIYSTSGADKQPDFVAIVKHGQDTNTENDTQVVAAKQVRGEAICSLLSASLAVEGWTGTVSYITTELGNDKGYAKIKIAKGVEMKARNIDPDSDVFKQLSRLTKGQKVTFSGTFVEDAKYCIKEDSTFSKNGLITPDFLMSFDSIEPQAKADK